MAKNGFNVCDSDLHVLEPHDLYLQYMDPKWGDRIPRGNPREAIQSVHYVKADGAPVRTVPAREAGHAGAVWSLMEAVERRESARFQVGIDQDFDPKSQLQAMDIEGIDVAVLFRTVPLHTDDAQEPEYAMALCRAWNDWISEFCQQDPSRLKAAGLVTLHDADLAVEEIRRIITEWGHVGVCMTPEPIRGRQLAEPYFDPVWAEAERLGVPICFHPSFFPNQVHWSNRFSSLPGVAWLVETFDQPMENVLAVVYFTAGGILERFPSLRVAFLEGNCSWLPWLLYRLDERYELFGDSPEVTSLSLKPSEYFLRQCFISVDVDEYLVSDVIKRLGDNNLVFSTDYPHADCKFPKATETFLAMDGLTESSKRKILWDNSVQLYKLESEITMEP